MANNFSNNIRFPAACEKNVLWKIREALEIGDETLLNVELDKNSELAYKTWDFDQTLLQVVARCGSLEAANRLIQLGSDIDAQDDEGRTPLYLAIEWKAEMVQYLLSRGADITISPKNGQSVLQQALWMGSLETVHILVSQLFSEYLNLEKHEKADNYKQSVTYDEQENNEELRNEKSETDFLKCRLISTFLLSQDTVLNFPNSKYSLLLHFVMMHGDEETFKFILQEGKNLKLHAPCPEKRTILHYAVYENKKDCIKHLVDFGIDINIEDYAKRTALHYAVRKNDPQLVKYLLNLRSIIVNKKTRDSGYTPLHIAVAVGNKEIIDMLLKAGADIKAKCESGRTIGQPRCKLNHQSSMLNFVCGQTVLRMYLSSPGIDFSHTLLINKNHCNREKMIFNKDMIKFLLERGAETEVYDYSYDKNSATPLHRACETGRLDIVQLLLEYEADLYSQDCYERTMLHYAVLGNNVRVVELLLGKNFDINVKDKYGRTPLYNFVQENVGLINRNIKQVCEISMVDFLVDNGAEVNVHCGTVNDTPLHWASRLRNPNFIECLLELKADYKTKDKNGHVSFTYESFNKNWNSEFASLTESGNVLIAFMALTEYNFYGFNDCNVYTLKRMQLADDLFKKCRLEVQKLKETNLCDRSHVTFYTFLTNELMKVSKFARSEKVMQILESGEYKNEFPCYNFLLEKRIERVKEMLYIENYLTDFIEEYATMKLPIVVIDKILSYLSVGDFRNFGRALSLL